MQEFAEELSKLVDLDDGPLMGIRCGFIVCS